MIRLLHEVDYNKYDKTFYFNDAVNDVRNVFIRHGEHLVYIIYYISTKDSTDKTLTLWLTDIYKNTLRSRICILLALILQTMQIAKQKCCESI